MWESISPYIYMYMCFTCMSGLVLVDEVDFLSLLNLLASVLYMFSMEKRRAVYNVNYLPIQVVISEQYHKPPKPTYKFPKNPTA